ncbi:MAG TPA: stage II sporulation protein M [Thermodesulfovibrionia bacterium]|nr:MAG: hypothetical protein A3H23_02385 [Planctomycetes bacterium RIFCSPLOWO2_12_FULL_40_19]HLA50322.1 stage II sporulation protein M [Thermodesulfovibrionia bacterium]
MIINLQKFIEAEKDYWTELEVILDKIENEPEHKMAAEQVKQFHYLFQRTSADLAKIATFSSEPEIFRYLESLTARAYGNIHEIREKPYRLFPLKWFFYTFPQTFRRHIRAFYLSLAITFVGFVFGGIAISFDPMAKEIVLPFRHLQGSPSERVANEEKVLDDRIKGVKMTGATWYMTHNTKVSIFVMASGITWGIGTIILLFYNGVILGAVALDYILAGQSKFLLAWLSPHGIIEIPAVLLAGQAGLVLANALIGWGKRTSLRMRFREISGNLVTLVLGVGIMLVWAGFIEAFISQYHEPVIPYSFKIAFGIIELILLVLFLSASGTKIKQKDA